jgi:predicted lipoprotein with Yx(FWY)xxD motif
MTSPRRTSLLAGAAAVLVIALLAGCGGGSSTPSAPKTTSGHAATLGVASTDLGKILVDSKARTVYLFKGDSGSMSACTGACAAAWPPLVASGTPTAGDGAKSALLATTKRPDGASQLLYHGHPLYLYQGDTKPGDTNGQGVNAFGAGWYALSANGAQVSKKAASSGGSYY